MSITAFFSVSPGSAAPLVCTANRLSQYIYVIIFIYFCQAFTAFRSKSSTVLGSIKNDHIDKHLSQLAGHMGQDWNFFGILKYKKPV